MSDYYDLYEQLYADDEEGLSDPGDLPSEAYDADNFRDQGGRGVEPR